MSGRVGIDRDGPVAILSLENPEKKNALGPGMREALLSHLEVLADDPEIACLVLRGENDAFCAGSDLQMLAQLGAAADGAARLGALLNTAGEVVLRLACDMPKPTIAAIRGPAVGAGLALALACDYRLAASDAVLKTGYAKVGLSVDWGASVFLPLRVGASTALDLCLTNPTLMAERAQELGLVDEVVSIGQHERRWREHARRWAEVAPLARRNLVRSLRKVTRSELAGALALEREHQLECFSNPDSKRLVQEYLARNDG